MTEIEITFFNTKPWVHGDVTFYMSTTPKETILKKYNTKSVKRAMAFARLHVRRLRAKDPERYKTETNPQIRVR